MAWTSYYGTLLILKRKNAIVFRNSSQTGKVTGMPAWSGGGLKSEWGWKKYRFNILILLAFHFSLFESSQSLFWASFGMVGLENFELEGIKSYTRFWGLLMFGSYSVINVIVLLNLLIAMMSNSYAMIEVTLYIFGCLWISDNPCRFLSGTFWHGMEIC